MKYKVLHRADSRGDLFEIETTDIFEVVDEHGVVIRTYRSDPSSGVFRDGTWAMDGSGGLWVELTEDGKALRLIRGNDVTIEPLP